MSDNPLVAGKQDATSATTGITIVEDAQSLHHGIESGSWVEGGLGAIGTAADVAMLATNPIATLTSYGLNWLIEHVQPLQDALDWVAGDPAQISAYATTWQNVSPGADGRRAGGRVAAGAGSGARVVLPRWAVLRSFLGVHVGPAVGGGRAGRLVRG